MLLNNSVVTCNGVYLYMYIYYYKITGCSDACVFYNCKLP